MNFGPHIVTHLESPPAGLYDPKILWAKVQKRLRYGGGAKSENPHFLETDELWSTYFALLESPRAGLQVSKILWTKVQKRRRYHVGGQNTENPHYLGKIRTSGNNLKIILKFSSVLGG